MNLIDLFGINLIDRPDGPAIQFQGGTLTFGELLAQSNGVACAFQRYGLQKGDRVAFYLNNSFEFIIAYLANLKLGFVTVPINTQYRDMEITHIIGDATPRLILTDRTQWKILEPIRAQLTSVERVVLAEELGELSKGAINAIECRGDDNDLAAIMYTSGTTGRSKGAMLTHGNFVSNITGLVSAWRWTMDDRLLLSLPLFHMHGLSVALRGTLTTGCTTILHSAFRPQSSR